MNNIGLNIKGEIDFGTAQREAKRKASEMAGDVLLVSYYDRAKDKVVPAASTICMGRAGYRVYAESRDVGIRVTVNDGEYDFYFLEVPDGVPGPTEDHGAFTDAHNID